MVVRPLDGGYQLIAGERRLEAARLAGLAEVPVFVRDCSDREQLELALVENLQREDLNPIESALAYKRLMEEFELSQEQVAEQVGKSRPAVANTMRLLNLPSIIQQSLMEGKISEGHGRALLGIESDERLLELWRQVQEHNLSVRETEALVARLSSAPVSRETKRARILDPNLVDLLARLELALGTRVRLRPRARGGTVEIQYYSEEDLTRICDHLLETP